MLKIFKVIIPAALLLSASMAYAADSSAPAVATAPAAIKIGVLDMQQIMQQSPQVATLNKQLQSQFQPRQQKIVAAQKSLQDEMGKLNKDSTVMSASDRSSLQDKIISDRASFQAMVQSYQQDLQSAQNQAMQKFMADLQTAVGKVAKQDKYTLIVQRAAVPYLDPSLDVTNQVINSMPKS